MKRTPVSSRSVAEVGYDEPSATLEIAFVNGSVYQYFDVPKHVVDELMGSESIGGYFSSAIRGVFRYARV